MNRKILKTFIVLFIFTIIGVSLLTLKLLFAEMCFTNKIFHAFKDLNYNHINTCISKGNLNYNIKKLLKNSPTLYEFARKIKRQYVSGYNKDFLNLENSYTDFENLENFKYVNGLLSKKNKGINKFNNNELLIENSSWLRSHGGNWNTHFSNSDLIDKKNIKNLKLLWKKQSIQHSKIEKEWLQNSETNPIYINKKIIYITADWKIIALDALSGKKIWDLQSIFPPSRRGITSFIDKNKKEYLFLPIGDNIYKVHAETGKLVNSFGSNGSINITTIIPPMIYKNFLVVASIHRAVSVFDLNTGEQKFSMSIHLNKRNSRLYFKGGTPWGGVALDKTKGLVYVVTGNPLPSLYGANRPGSNKNSSSIVAFDLKSKKILWTFQDVNHDLWDFDIAAPPIIHNLKINEKLFEVVIALTKTGNVLLLERNTGEPIFDLRYKKAPRSDIPNEKTSNYQLDLIKPEKFSKIEYSINDYNKLPNNKIKEVEKLLINSKFGWFETPSFKKDLITFGLHGGAEWTGAALDPFNHELFIPTANVPWKLKPYLQSMELNNKKFAKDKSVLNLYYNKCSSCHGKKRNGINVKSGEKTLEYIPSLVGLVGDNFWPLYGKNYFNEQFYKSHKNKLNDIDLNKLKSLFAKWDKYLYENKLIRVESDGQAWSQFLTSDGLPASNPPWGYIAKINLTNGKLIWKKAIGKKLINDKWIQTGSPIFGGVALNKNGVLFVTGTDDNFIYAIDSETGDNLWSYEMKASGSAPPTIFEINGKEYVTVVSTGGRYHSYVDKDSTIYTFSIN